MLPADGWGSGRGSRGNGGGAVAGLWWRAVPWIALRDWSIRLAGDGGTGAHGSGRSAVAGLPWYRIRRSNISWLVLQP